MDRVIFFVDGFNLYHSLISCSKEDPNHQNYKWLDLKKYLIQFLDPKKEILAGIYYFSAFYPWSSSHPLMKDLNKEIRHRIFKQAIESTGVKTFFGKFFKHYIHCPYFKENKCSLIKIIRNKICSSCPGKYEKPEEKQTDVDLGVTMLKLAVKNEYDTATLVSGDTDFIPAIKAIKELCPNKKIGVLFPFKRSNRHFLKFVDFQRKTNLEHVINSKFPNTIILANGTRLSCPPEWI